MKSSDVFVDVKAQEEGECHPHPYFDGITVKVRGSSSDAVEKRRTALLNRLPQKRRKTGDAVADNRRIELFCTAHCLLDVKGFDDVTYSEDLGREWAADPRWSRFLDGVRELADEIGVREQEAHEASVSD
jgi:hypothetical protein